MLEFPEAFTVARQVRETLAGQRIVNVTAAHSPHKFAWYHGDPQDYNALLFGKTIDEANVLGGMVEIKAGNCVILFCDGVAVRFHHENEPRPKKHQLLIDFANSTALSTSVQMYGGLWCFKEDEFESPYYTVAREKPSPLSDEFDQVYFEQLISLPDVQKLSAKAFLATEQRIPGLGNGVLQDILWQANIHPKCKVKSLSAQNKTNLFSKVKNVLGEMTQLGGRDTEKDLFGKPGGYKTVMSKNNVGRPCPACGGLIRKESYMGGSVYYCADCQPTPGSNDKKN